MAIREPKFANGAWMKCDACGQRHPVLFDGPRALNTELAIICLCGSVMVYVNHEVHDNYIKIDFDFHEFNGDVARKGIAKNVNEERGN